MASDFPDASIDVARDDGSTMVVSVEGERAAEIERSVLDLAWVVKQCAPWSVGAR